MANVGFGSISDSTDNPTIGPLIAEAIDVAPVLISFSRSVRDVRFGS